MFDISSVKLPASLLLSDNYSTLNPKQKKNFVARINYIGEIVQAGFDCKNVDNNLLLECIDDIEVDALAIMSAFSDPESSVTPYAVHSSWMFDCNLSDKEKLVVRDAERLLAAPSFGFNMSIIEVKNWIQCWAMALYSTIKTFVEAVSYTEVIVQLIVADALVALFLAFAAVARLNVQLIT